jgi:alkaline ceramidase
LLQFITTFLVRRLNEGKATRLGIRSSFLWGAALFCWINDRLFCDAWSSIRFPYLHGFWHVLVCIAAYSGCVLYAYLYAREQCPNEKPVLKFWPSDKCEILSFPYVALRARRPHDLEKEHVKDY